LPFSLRVLLENLLRHAGSFPVTAEDVQRLAAWEAKGSAACELPFKPARVLLQDFTGVPCLVDLAAMRSALARSGGDPARVNPLVPCDLVVDHSVQVDAFGSPEALSINRGREFERNRERYAFLKWGSLAFQNFRVVPPGTGIVHQVNLEYLASVVMTRKQGGETLVFPDTLVGTDSHTTMINGLGVLGWGVGGIEAEAAMLGQPVSVVLPPVVGVRLTGRLREGVTATDLVLTVTERLRAHGVVGKFVEFFGSGVTFLSLADRATVANMAPEYGATVGFFPVDEETLNYLRLTSRPKEVIERAEIYCKEQKLFRTKETPDPAFSDTLELDLGTVEPSLAGPKRPQDRVLLNGAKRSFREALLGMMKDQLPELDPKRLNGWLSEGGSAKPPQEELMHGESLGGLATAVRVKADKEEYELRHGSVVIAAITSCTNTSNPQVMIGAGLLAKKAVERGLFVKPWVKTSLAPGSKVVMDYLRQTKLLGALEKLRFHLVGFGCTTCIGNSGPLSVPITQAIKSKDLLAAAVLSGNRNFEGRINPLVRANYLASPPLVVAYAIAGTMDIDLAQDPIGTDPKGNKVYLRDIWPSQEEIRQATSHVKPEMFQKEYAHVFEGDENWRSMKVPAGDTFVWDPKSTYVKNPTYFENLKTEPSALKDIQNARVLVMVGDSVTTDHISPAGSIDKDAPAGKYLIAQGVDPKDFNSYGSRRGNHEVMMRGTFANIRLRNLLAPGTEGGWTRHFPDGEKMSIYDAAMKYQKEKVPLMVLAGKEYGSGSSRDWAAKGPALLGVKAVIAESFERIHRSNLIGMGILPLEFEKGQNRESLGLGGEEIYSIQGIEKDLKPGKKLNLSVRANSGEKKFTALCRIDTPVELSYYQHGGILPYILRQLLKG